MPNPNGTCDTCGALIGDPPPIGPRRCTANPYHDPYGDGWNNGGDPFVPLAPAGVIAGLGLIFDHGDPIGRSDTGGLTYRVRFASTLRPEVGEMTFDYTDSARAAEMGEAPDPCDVLGCLLSDFRIADEWSHVDRDRMADGLWREMGGSGEVTHPPSYWLNLADDLIRNAGKVRALLGAGVEFYAAAVEW